MPKKTTKKDKNKRGRGRPPKVTDAVHLDIWNRRHVENQKPPQIAFELSLNIDTVHVYLRKIPKGWRPKKAKGA